MKKNGLKLSTFLLIVGFLFAASCSKKDDDTLNTDKNKTEKVPDPEGTITVNISESTEKSTGISIYGSNYYVGWTKPDNFYLSNYGNLVSICNVGNITGLGNITKIPVSGFTIPTPSSTNIACETGHGYVIKFESNSEIAYIRLYVVEKIVSTSGGIMGAKVKYQFPFEP
jgi:hypothetical protein